MTTAPLLTVKELAAELGLDPDTIYRWVAEDSKLGATERRIPVPVLRLGRTLRFRRADLNRFLYGDTDQVA
jgi:excisionase family DNA binding protein